MLARKVFIFDTTLRDGEQSPGAALNIEEKIQIARQLAKLNVDVIEAGFPISSPGDFEAVSRIAKEIEGPEICGLSRVLEPDITRCWEAIKHASNPRIHTFVGISDSHIKGILRKTREEVLKMAVDAVTYSRSLCETVEFSPMDATRAEPSYLYEVVAAVIEAGAAIINIPDTVGYAVPEQFGQLIRDIRQNVKDIDRVVVSVHCHNDLGLAVANSLAAIKNGAQQVECAINGLGERAGNASLEEVVMAIQTRRDFFNDVHTDINAKELYPISRLVSRLVGIEVPLNKAVVGANAFSHSSGIHQDGFLKDRQTFEIIKPEDVGIKESRLVLTPRSGRHALQHRLVELGYEVTDEMLNKIYGRFIELADRKKEIYDADLEVIAREELGSIQEIYVFDHLEVHSFSNCPSKAYVWLTKNGEKCDGEAVGNGPVDATYKAIEHAIGMSLKLEEYKIEGVTPGEDAMGDVTVKVSNNGRVVVGHGSSTDIVEGSALALVNALNKFFSSSAKNNAES